MRFNFFISIVFGALTGFSLCLAPNRLAAQQPAVLHAPTANAPQADTSPAAPQAAALESSEIQTENFSDVLERGPVVQLAKQLHLKENSIAASCSGGH